MFRNYLKISIRHLKKNKGFSLLNIFGLSLGMTCAILILLWVQDEVSYNRFHAKYETLHQVMDNQTYEGKTYTFSATPGMLSDAIKTEIPEIQNTTRMDWGNRWLFTLGDRAIYEDGKLVDPSLLDMFSFPLIYGDRATALADEHSIVITDKMAEKFFGSENPVGKYIKVGKEKEMKISGVVSEPPRNSSIKFSWLASFKIFEKENNWWKNWGSNGVQTFVELKPGASPEQVSKKLYNFIQTKSSDAAAHVFLLPMDDWRLRSNFTEGKQDGGRIEYVRLFSIIALLLILIACINFMNLATARSEQRMREVGVRKVMGAERFALMKQFIGESLFMSFLSLVVACVLVLIALPFFNELVEKKLTIGLTNPMQWLILSGIALACGLVAGSYPSFYLSSFNPVSIFKGMKAGRGSAAVLVRKGLVVTQFAVSVVLIISTLIVFKQIQHVKDRQLGYNKDNLIFLDLNGSMNEHLDVIRQELISTGQVVNAATCSQNLLNEGSNTGGVEWEGKDPTKEILITVENGSPGFIQTAGMQLIAGRDFYPDWKTDTMNIIINEAFARLLNKPDPIGMVVRNDNAYHVIGVVKDFVYNDFYKAPAPYILFCDPRYTFNLFIRIKDNANTTDALAQIEKVIRKNNPGYPFEYRFVDAEFDKLFKSEMLVAKLSRLFAVLTIFISCLGLFGLAAYTAERRTKEIGIRKVLGASVSRIAALLSADFLKLVVVSFIIAFPLGWYIMQKWLEDYEYRIHISWTIFLSAGVLAILIACATVSFQAIKAALTNPVKNLRTE